MTLCVSARPPSLEEFRRMPPSCQDTRKGERDAAKRAQGQAGSAGAAAALVHLLGDWNAQNEDHYEYALDRAVGAKIVKQKAAEGGGEVDFVVFRCLF